MTLVFTLLCLGFQVNDYETLVKAFSEEPCVVFQMQPQSERTDTLEWNAESTRWEGLADLSFHGHFVSAKVVIIPVGQMRSEGQKQPRAFISFELQNGSYLSAFMAEERTDEADGAWNFHYYAVIDGGTGLFQGLQGEFWVEGQAASGSTLRIIDSKGVFCHFKLRNSSRIRAYDEVSP